MQRGEHAGDERLAEHRGEHLAPAGAESPQQRELPQALADDDAEGVVDEERAGDERDEPDVGEDLAQGADALLELLGLLVDRLLAGDGLGGVGQERLGAVVLDLGDPLGPRDVGAELRRRRGRDEAGELLRVFEGERESDAAGDRGAAVGEGLDAVVLEGTSVQVYLGLWNRGAEVRSTDPDVLDAWQRLVRVQW